MTNLEPGLHIGLVACTKTKDEGCKTRAMPAGVVYAASQLFRAAVAHLHREGAGYYILSARHGLLAPTDLIRDYDETLATKGKADRRAWGDKVFAQMTEAGLIGARHVWVVHAGRAYSEHLVELLKEAGEVVDQPLKGQSLFQRRSWYRMERIAAEQLAAQRILIERRHPGVLPTADPLVADDAPLADDAPRLVRWPCKGTGPGVVRSKQGLYRAMPFPPRTGWIDETTEEGGSRTLRRQWRHPRPITRPDHERRAFNAAVVDFCPVRKRWTWTLIMPHPIGQAFTDLPRCGTADTPELAADAADAAHDAALPLWGGGILNRSQRKAS